MNTGTAVAMITTGDAVAQKIESGSFPVRVEAVGRGTSPPGQDSHTLGTLAFGSSSSGPISFYCEEHIIASREVQWKLLDTHGESLDLARTVTMAAWAAIFYTPFYMTLYRVFDRYLPRQGVLPIASRVGLSFASSVPVNAAFYLYGTLAQHAIGCEKIRDGSSKEIHWREALTAARQKIETQLPNTVATSSMVWIPINVLNFSIVPVHLRPLVLMVCSAGWNCYLSLKQHQ